MTGHHMGLMRGATLLSRIETKLKRVECQYRQGVGMYFKCDISGISAEQLAAVSAVETLYSEQNMICNVMSFEPLVFELKPQFSAQMRERLMSNRVPHVLKGYTGQIVGNTLVVQKEAGADAPKRRRKRADQGNADIRTSEEV